MIVKPQSADSASVQELIYALRTRYRFLRTAPIGYSVLGKPIYALTVGNGTDRVLYAAAFHAQERITAPVLLRFCEELCEALQSGTPLADVPVRRALAGRTLVFVPMVNPDGADIAVHGSAAADAYAETVASLGGDTPGLWQANVRGVDINHNFRAGWTKLREAEREAGITGPSPRQYGGEHPESEPETRALTRLCRRARFRHALALHTQGEEIYWRYGEHTPPRSRLMAEILASASGYAIADPNGLASHGGFKDWMIDELHRPAFTVEMGKGKNPLPDSDLDDIASRTREMLLLAGML